MIVALGTNEQGEEIMARIVFVRDRNRRKNWLALLTTDLSLPEEEVIRIYGKRWDIEVFFKMTKSFLKLAKEFQGRSYDMMVAHTSIVLSRYTSWRLSRGNPRIPEASGIYFSCAAMNCRTSSLPLPCS